ncbi:MAG: hypothetical protein Q8N34_09055 [Gammaproteobacteria bacterium]|nr:hypothetical protein [Gammaproteobacteria bacterium]
MDYRLNPRDAALKNLGRTIINFQCLEQHVKALATIQSFTGSLSKIQQDREKHIKKTLGLTLGQAINSWMETLHGSRPSQPLVADMFEITMQGHVQFDFDLETKAQHAEELRELLEYRNELIHGKRLALNWDSDSECETLFAELDDWNRRIGVQVDFLVAIRRGFADIKPEDFEVDESDD